MEWRELKACDYGAPTIRKRFFLIARCDGNPIVWPDPTHGPGKLPYHTAAEIIDWSLPCPSIFERKKPLAENTMKRIAKGIMKFVIENPAPFIVEMQHQNKGYTINTPLHTIKTVNHQFVITPMITQIGQTGFSDSRSYSIEQALTTIVSKNEHCLVTPFLTQYHSYDSDSVRGQTMDNPLLTVDTSNRYALVCAFLSKYYGGTYEGCGSDCNKPLHTITGKDHNALVAATMIQTGYGERAGQQPRAIDINKTAWHYRKHRQTCCCGSISNGILRNWYRSINE